MKHIMLDLETLGTDPNSVILSVGMVRFDPEKPYKDASDVAEEDKLYLRLPLQDQLDAGRVVSASTISWWMDQGDDAKRVFSEKHLTMKESLTAIVNFLKKSKFLWGNGSSFDCVLLEDMFRSFNIGFPMAYFDYRDVRTIVDLAGVKPLKLKELTAHNALGDALKQTLWVQECYAALNNKTTPAAEKVPAEKKKPAAEEKKAAPATKKAAPKEAPPVFTVPDDGSVTVKSETLAPEITDDLDDLMGLGAEPAAEEVKDYDHDTVRAELQKIYSNNPDAARQILVDAGLAKFGDADQAALNKVYVLCQKQK